MTSHMTLIISSSPFAQVQREDPAAAPCLHLPSGAAAELGGELLRGPLRHPHPGAAQDGKQGGVASEPRGRGLSVKGGGARSHLYCPKFVLTRMGIVSSFFAFIVCFFYSPLYSLVDSLTHSLNDVFIHTSFHSFPQCVC